MELDKFIKYMYSEHTYNKSLSSEKYQIPETSTEFFIDLGQSIRHMNKDP